jgi:hypothetical protein
MSIMRKSNSGTSNIKSDLRLTRILAIIEACHQTGVSSFELGRLKITFDRNQGALNQGHTIQDGSSAVSDNKVDIFNQQIIEDAEHAQLMIDDPLGYEQAQAMRDVERQRQRE